MRLVPATILAGGREAADRLLARLGGEATRGGIAVVRDEGLAASADCACCALADGLTRRLREAHFAAIEGHGPRASRVLVDAAGHDPRAAIAAFARFPLASLGYALDGVAAVGNDPLAEACADTAPDAEAAGWPELLHGGLYPEGRLEAAGWVERGLPGALRWARPEPAAWADVESAVQAIQMAAGTGLLRLKALAGVAGEPGPRLLQAIGHTRYPSARLPQWPPGPRTTRFAIALQGLEERRIARILDSMPRA